MMVSIRQIIAQVVLGLSLIGQLAYAAPQVSPREGVSKEIAEALQVCALYYEDGQYAEALQRCQKILDKYKSQGYAQLLIKPTLAKYYLSMGNFVAFDKTIHAYLRDSKEYRGSNSTAYAVAALKVAARYAEYGNIPLALGHLEAADEKLLPAGWERTQRRIIATQLDYIQGNYDQVLSRIEGLLRDRAQQLTPEQERFNPLINGQERFKLTDTELRILQNQYAQLFHLKAEAAREKGDFYLAQITLDRATQWINENLSPRDIAALDNQYRRLLLRLDEGKDRQSIQDDLDKLLFRVEKKVGKAHALFLDVQETLIDYFVQSKYLVTNDKNKQFRIQFLARNRERRKTNYHLWDINQSSKMYYGKDHQQFARTQRLDAKQDLKRINLDGAEAILMPLYQNHDAVPLLHPERIKIAHLLYHIKLEQGDLPKAEQFLKDYIDRTTAIFGKSSIQYEQAQIEKANFLFRYTNDFEQAKQLLQTHIPALQARLLPNQERYLHSLDAWTEYYEMTDNYAAAQEKIDESLRHTRKQFGENHPRYATQLIRWADLMMAQGDYAVVDSTLQLALKIFDKTFNPNLNKDYAQALEVSAHLQATMGLYEEAKTELQKARNQYYLHAGIFNRFRDLDQAALSENADELAYLYIQSEEYARAELLLKLIIAKRKDIYGENSRFLVKPYNEMARLRRIEGDYMEADQYIMLAYDIATENYGENSLKVVPSLEILADIKTSIGDYAGAEEFAEKAMDIKQEALGTENIGLANTYVQIALIKYYSGNPWEEVQVFLDKAEDVASNLGQQNPIYAVVLQNIASIYLERGELAKADQNLRQVRDIWLALSKDSRKKIADIDVLIAQVDFKEGKLKDAERKLLEALKDYKKVFSKTHPDYINAQADLARVYYKIGDLKKAQQNIQQVLAAHKAYIKESFPVLSDREKAKAWGLRRNDFEFFANFAIQQRQKYPELIEALYDNVLLTKSVLLSSSKSVRNRILNSGNDSLIANFNRWTANKNDLIQAAGLAPDQLKESGIDLKALQDEVDRLEKILSRQSSDFASEETTATWTAVKNALQPNEYAVEIIRVRHYDDAFTDSVVYVALIVQPNTNKPTLAAIPNGNDLEDYFLKNYRNSMRYRVEDYDSYYHFWEPIDKHIAEGSRVYVSPDKAYTQLNIESLLLENGDYVIDKDDVLLVTTTQDLIERNPTSTRAGLPDGMAFFGNPKFYPETTEAEEELPVVATLRDRGVDLIKPLPGAQKEVKEIAEMIQDRHPNLFIQEEASEERITELLNTSKPRLFHFATHGFFEPDLSDAQRAALQRFNSSDNSLLRSGLLFKNAGLLMRGNSYHEYNLHPGVLTAYEVSSMNFNDAYIVMSACETGLGDIKVGEGVYGLQRAFLIAGAKQLIMSLFKVDDEATRALMRLFYQKWKNSGDVQSAFREAKRELREDFPEPIYWGAFVMIGG